MGTESFLCLDLCCADLSLRGRDTFERVEDSSARRPHRPTDHRFSVHSLSRVQYPRAGDPLAHRRLHTHTHAHHSAGGAPAGPQPVSACALRPGYARSGGSGGGRGG